ncbi:MAG: type II CAAX endopeptidase family protein [Bacteroidota bacterium]
MNLAREPLLRNNSSPLRMLALLLIILVSILFTLIFGMAGGYLLFGSEMMDYIKDGQLEINAEMIPMLKYLQIVNTLGIFVFPPLIFAFLVSKKPAKYLKLDQLPALISAMAGVAVIIVILPFLHWTAGLNEMLNLPEYMAGIERWMKNSEEQAMEITTIFLNTGTITGLMLNLIMIAVLPAIGEELLFRGVLLRLFREWTGYTHLAVIISALLFSALHLQFYGFLPRFILGMFLGYMFVWTGSVWVPVIVHFFNNGIAVVAAYLYERGTINTEVNSLGETHQPYIIISSLLMVLLLIIVIRYYEGKKKGSTIE